MATVAIAIKHRRERRTLGKAGAPVSPEDWQLQRTQLRTQLVGGGGVTLSSLDTGGSSAILRRVLENT